MDDSCIPMVSVGIPTYNQSEFLRQAIQSVLNQTFQDFEVIVVDDCSTDNTPDVVRQFDDRRIRYHRTDVNLRPPRSWNECVRIAQGEYFAILPHDDLYEPTFLARMISALDQNPSVGFAQCAHFSVNEDLPVLEERYIAKKEFVARGEEALLIQTRRHLMNPASILFRRNSVVKHGLWKVYYWDDEVLILKIGFHDGFVYLPYCLSSVRAHSLNLSNTLIKEDFDSILAVINQETAIFADVLPMTPTLLKLRSEWNRRCGYSCAFYALKALMDWKWQTAKDFLVRSICLYPSVFIDPRFYILVVKKIILKTFRIK